MSHLSLEIRYEWQEGSIPPPYHYEYTIRIGPGLHGAIEFRPDYEFNDPPIWRESFTLSTPQLATLYELMKAQGVIDREWQRGAGFSVGGRVERLEGTVGEQVFSIPSELDPEDAAAISPVYRAIRSLVPESIWTELMSRRSQYEQEYLGKAP
ncbi:MAG: hypothetical protein PVI80_14025 [Anaerolineae bacterium]|jgi:hypothetical protein